MFAVSPQPANQDRTSQELKTPCFLKKQSKSQAQLSEQRRCFLSVWWNYDGKWWRQLKTISNWRKKSQCCEEFSVDHQKRKDAFFFKKAMYEYCLAVITVAYVENRSEKKIEILYLIVMENLVKLWIINILSH